MKVADFLLGAKDVFALTREVFKRGLKVTLDIVDEVR
jgi:hypothetical protein